LLLFGQAKSKRKRYFRLILQISLNRLHQKMFPALQNKFIPIP
jgi:hypothetical protein